MDVSGGKPEAALEWVLRQARIVPDSFEIQFILGSLYLKMSRPDEAKAAFTRALAINPGYARATVELSRVFMMGGQYRDGIGVGVGVSTRGAGV